METFELIANIVTIIGLPIAIISILFSLASLRQTKKIEEGKFLIELRKMFAQHDHVHYKLRNGGEWTIGNNPIPDETEEWAKIDSYLGLFELCEILIQNGSLSQDHFSSQYKYRLENIIASNQIVLKIRDERNYWTNLFRIINRVSLNININ
jgi:hypothetical protein